MHKEIIDKDTFMSPKMEGMKKLASIVKRTLGPGGLTIFIQRVGQSLDGSPLSPKLTKDGVSVAQECSDPNEAVDIVIQAVKAICKKTNADAGDGTTTAIVLGEAILEETEKVLRADKSLNPQLVKESLEEASREVIAKLKELSISVTDDMSKIREVAAISANGDAEIGKIIGDAFEHVGAEGVVTVDEGSSNKVTLDVVDGYQFSRGAEGRDIFYNSKAKTHFETSEKTAVIIFDGKIMNYTDVIPTLLMLAGADPQTGKGTRQMPPVLFIANEFSQPTLQFLFMQKEQRGLQICCVEGPHVTHVRTGYYDDLAKYSGGARLGNGGRSLANIKPTDVGFVGRVFADKYKTTLYDGAGKEADILERVDQIRAMKAKAESPYDVQILNDRLAALTSGVAKIGVGGSTELEVKEKYDRIEDALNAARAAIQEGVVPGGGTALLRIANSLVPTTIGLEILKKALRAPFNQILENIEVKLSDADVEQICSTANLVYDARNKKLTDCMEAGIIDPVKVTRSALENAVSIAGLLSTTGGAIIYRSGK